MNYRETLNLPTTNFPMKANLSVREKDILKFWEGINLYQLLLEKNKNKPKFILHDGPPFSNGNIHLGHALNKILKDIIVKFKFMQGYFAPYIPGWDCHGLPTELQALKSLKADRKNMNALEVRKICTQTAEKFMKIQREEFKRLGVIGDWENPYLTMNPKYEETILLAFLELVKKNCIYKKNKPVYWCGKCETALAEAEVEYEDTQSPSIYVAFKCKDFNYELKNQELGVRSEKLENYEQLTLNDEQNFSVVIWTTTPWTLPANQAVAVHPELVYSLIKIKKLEDRSEKSKEKTFSNSPTLQFSNYFTILILKDLIENFCKENNYELVENIKDFSGKELEGLQLQHPFIERKVPVILANYVSSETGTGCVHTAPGHGEEDYQSGLKYNLPIFSPLDDKGRFNNEVEVESLIGKKVFEANEEVINILKQKNKLLGLGKITHSYPHCWRCKSKVIFRATPQWFIALDNYIEKALQEIDKVKWIPQWGKDRILGMVKDRPAWCISRQRVWGVPIPAFYCENCNELVLQEETIKNVAEIIGKEGTDVWFKKNAKELLPNNYQCLKCGSKNFKKEKDILDVWFDSGSSNLAVLEKNNNLSYPADLYLEGSDQHRGWFQGSLWIALVTKNLAPYKQVLTHGFIVDEEERKMSKSIGNVIAPQEVVNKLGADILRLFIASVDFRNDIKVSEKILAQIAESYRKIRNTLRFLLSNLYDFNPQENEIAYEQLLDIDKYILCLLYELQQKIISAYQNYEFHLVYHLLNNFCVVTLSSFYLDILKDKLYTFAPNSLARRSAQTVLYKILQTITKQMSPILSFTAEEVWQEYRRQTTEKENCELGIKNYELNNEQLTMNDERNYQLAPSIFLADINLDEKYNNEEIKNRFERILQYKEKVNKELENLRAEKIIHSSLEAEVKIIAEKKELEFLKSFGEELKSMFIVSEVHLQEKNKEVRSEKLENDKQLTINDKQIIAYKSQNKKCERCWNYSKDVGKDIQFPTICLRCVKVLKLIRN